MPDYRPLDIAAGNLHATEDDLIDFNRSGWIDLAVKDGYQFISGKDEYRARFILHLREKLELTKEEIGIVLSNEKPPYSLDQVPSILGRCRDDPGSQELRQVLRANEKYQSNDGLLDLLTGRSAVPKGE